MIRPSIALAAAAVTALSGWTHAQQADDGGSKPTRPLTAVDRSILESAATLERNIAEFRGLEYLAEVDKVILTRDELAAELATELAAEESMADIAQETLLLRAVGALSDGEDLAEIYRSIYTVLIQGFYDPSDGQLHCISGQGWSTQVETMVHELYHALQDQHFDLEAYTSSEDELTHDAYRARQAVVEGEAEAFTAAYLEAFPMGGIARGGSSGDTDPPGADRSSARDDHESSVESSSAPTGASATAEPAPAPRTDLEELLQSLAAEQIPTFFRNESAWPYLAGEQFVARLRDDGGWTRVAELYDTPPLSTEQVAHPDKYAAGELPLPAEFRVPAWAEKHGYHEALRETLGEIATMNLVHELSKDGIHALRGAQGWGGDCMVVLTDHAQRTLCLWRTRWDTEQDALEFQRAWRRSAQKELMARSEAPVWLIELDHTGEVPDQRAVQGRVRQDDHDFGTLNELPDGLSFHELAVGDWPRTWILRQGTQVLVLRGAVLRDLDPLHTAVPLLNSEFLTRAQTQRRRLAY